MILHTRHYAGMAVFAGATLFSQIALTRLFSVVEYYHGAFLAVSLALFGFAVSGVFVSLRQDAMGGERLDRSLGRYGLLFAVSLPIVFAFYLYLGVGPLGERVGLAVPSGVGSVLEYALLAVPFFASGVCISLLLAHGFTQANRLYAVDLCASALGAVIVIPALAWLGGPKSILLASAILAATTLLFRAGSALRVAGGALVVVAGLAAVLVPASRLNSFQIRKPPLVVAGEPIRWNAFSMVGVEPEGRVMARGGRGRAPVYRYRNIVIDNSVSTEMLALEADPRDARLLDQNLRADWNAAVHQLRPESEILIIGSGGGRDIRVALAHGARRIVAVEVNPLVFQMAQETFGEFTGHVYGMPGVEPHIGDARSYIANSDERYDVIMASLIDTWAASAAGAFALTENLLYTKDAFRDYYDHLNDDGILSIARWHPFETPRLLATGLAAWRDAGVEDPRRHAAVLTTVGLRGYGGVQIVTLLMKKTPFTPEELLVIEGFGEHPSRIAALTPEAINEPLIARYLEASAQGSGSPWPGVDVTPATDERPFFFNQIKPSTQIRSMLGLATLAPTIRGAALNADATRTLVQLFGVICLLLVFTVFTPLALRAGEVRQPGWGPILGYFVCLGLGFILIEIGLIQRLILLLGKPIYSLSVILSTMLLVSGFGSYASQRIPVARLGTHLGGLLLAAAALLLAYALFLPELIRAALGTPFVVRLAVAVAIVALPAFLLGMPFASGIRALGVRRGQAMIPWVWGVNGAMSVLASVGAIILAIEFGYTLLFVLGAACYAVAALLLRRWVPASAPPV